MLRCGYLTQTQSETHLPLSGQAFTAHIGENLWLKTKRETLSSSETAPVCFPSADADSLVAIPPGPWTGFKHPGQALSARNTTAVIIQVPRIDGIANPPNDDCSTMRAVCRCIFGIMDISKVDKVKSILKSHIFCLEERMVGGGWMIPQLIVRVKS